ncbi:MAG TPA: tRNA pseudouridine(38-40) synthase TruA [Vicinamibacterales bacterium]|nr:tRNA pseudouridine(38-40) synthase TruA [Vicinamibacterales bacterium]
MRTLKLTLAYDGTRFVGWQRQARSAGGRGPTEAGESVQGVLEEVLSRFEGAPVVVQGAGRTDAGVHALGQVASAQVRFEHDPATLVRALNAQLPAEIRVLSVEEVPEAFHARFSARAKTYRYQIRNAPLVMPFERLYVWHLPERLDVDAMRRAAGVLEGTHDFAAFRSAGGETHATVRTLLVSRVGWAAPCQLRLAPLAETPEGDADLLVYEVTGTGFLRYMVRAIVGTLVEIGRGWRAADAMRQLVDRGARADAGPTAPPQGLFLVSVDYDLEKPHVP